jgi:hypothetical protein
MSRQAWSFETWGFWMTQRAAFAFRPIITGRRMKGRSKLVAPLET